MVEFPKFKGFASETKLHGIPRTAEGSKVSIAFWAVLFAICVGMAANDLYVLVTLYQSEPTAIQMLMKKLPTDFNWTTPTLCMEMIADYDQMKAIGIPFGTPGAFSNFINDFIAQFYNIVSIGNNTEIRYKDGMSNPNILYYPYIMLGSLIELERQLMGQPMNRSTNIQFSLARNDPSAMKHAQLFYDAFLQYNVSMDKLTQVVGMWFCLQQLKGNIILALTDQSLKINGHMENYRYIGDPDYISLPICTANMITHLGFGMVCSKVFETPNVPLKPNYHYFSLYDTTKWMSLDLSLNAKLAPNLLFHLDLQGRNVIPPDDRTNVFSWSPADKVVLDITVSAAYQFLNLKKRSCSSSPVSQYDCKWQKRVDFVHQECGCWPSLADIQNQKSGRNCSVDPTNPLLNSIYNISVAQFCPNTVSFAPDLSECTMDCHLTNYSFTRYMSNIFPTQKRTWGIEKILDVVGSLEFRFRSDSYNLVTECQTAEWATFLGTWGGSIGTWLGASLLSFVHIPVYIVRNYCLPRSKASPTETA